MNAGVERAWRISNCQSAWVCPSFSRRYHLCIPRRFDCHGLLQNQSHWRSVVSAALRAPRHSYGGPAPFGTGAGVLRWEREAGALLFNHLLAERQKEWKRLRHRLIKDGPSPLDEQQLSEERLAKINRTRLKVQFQKFWDLMNERDRPWHFDVVMHLCTGLSKYTCRKYGEVTAGTMQGILAQRAKAERAVREQREAVLLLRRRLVGATIRMMRTGRPVSYERLGQLRLLLEQASAGAGIAASQLERLQQRARNPYRDVEYVLHADSLLKLLQETREVVAVARRVMLPVVEDLQAELQTFQADLEARRLSRDQVLAFLEQLRDRELPPALPYGWPELSADEHVRWRYPPMEYWRPRDSEAGSEESGGRVGPAAFGDGGGGGRRGGAGVARVAAQGLSPSGGDVFGSFEPLQGGLAGGGAEGGVDGPDAMMAMMMSSFSGGGAAVAGVWGAGGTGAGARAGGASGRERVRVGEFSLAGSSDRAGPFQLMDDEEEDYDEDGGGLYGARGGGVAASWGGGPRAAPDVRPLPGLFD